MELCSCLGLGIQAWGKAAATLDHGVRVYPQGKLLLEYGLMGYLVQKELYTPEEIQ